MIRGADSGRIARRFAALKAAGRGGLVTFVTAGDPDRATFETRVFWYNPTPLEQPYYNWMTGAAFARDDLEMTIPGDAYLTHPGDERPWPVDGQGRYLPLNATPAQIKLGARYQQAWLRTFTADCFA